MIDKLQAVSKEVDEAAVMVEDLHTRGVVDGWDEPLCSV